MLAWHIQKLLDKPKRFIQRCRPNRRGKKTTTKTSNQPCDQPDDTIPSMVQTASTSTHPKTEQTVTNQPNKKSLAHYRVLTQHTHALRETVSAPFEAACSTLLEINTLCQFTRNIVLFLSLRPVYLAVTVCRTDSYNSPIRFKNANSAKSTSSNTQMAKR